MNGERVYCSNLVLIRFSILRLSLSGKVVWFSSGNVVKIESTSPGTTTFRHFRRFTPCPGELMPWKTRSPLTRYLEESTSSGQTSGISRRFPVFHFSTLPFSPPLSSWLSITVLGSSFIVFQSIYRSNRYHLFPSPSQTICHNFLNDETI